MEIDRTECEKDLEECIQYFRQRPVYHKLFAKMWDKYRSLGHFGGAVQLSGLTPEECRQLGGFFQKDFERKKTVSISAAAMEKALEKSRFSGLKWETVLQNYFQEELVGKKEQRQQENALREQFFERIIAVYPRNPGCVWLREVLGTKGEGYLLLMKQYGEQPGKLRENLLLLMQAIPRLPFLADETGEGSCELLAVFAAETTGDPHFFDMGTQGEQLLTAFLKSYIPCPSATAVPAEGERAEICVNEGIFRPEEHEEVSDDGEIFRPEEREEVSDDGDNCRPEEQAKMPDDEEIDRIEDAAKISGKAGVFRTEEKAELLYKAGLVRDELSNNTLTYGLIGIGKNGERHEGISGFLKRREPLQLTLLTMRKLAQVRPQKGKRVYIVENPAVFAKLMRAWPEAAILCGNGQVRLATLILLELFDRETTFLYAGDYDPEGLQIAQRLKERYGERLQLWKYRRDLYEKYRSDVKIPEKSLQKLKHIYLKELQELKKAMLQQKKAAYQEAMLEEYLRDQ